MGLALLLVSCFLNAGANAQTQPLFKVVTNFPGCGGFNTHIFIDVDVKGNQVGGGAFSINFNPAILTNPIVTLGADAQAAGFIGLGDPYGNPPSASLNFNNVASGQIGMVLDSGGSLPTTPGDKRIVVIRFDVVPNSPTGPIPIAFGGTPTPRNVSAPGGDLYTPFTSQDGSLMVGGTACTTSANVSVGGRVMTSDGNGLRGAQVVLTDSNGNRRTVMTSSLGYYQLDQVKSGETYIIGVSSRRYRFSSRTLQVTDNLTDVDFIGLE